jgi:hypothetical protein
VDGARTRRKASKFCRRPTKKAASNGRSTCFESKVSGATNRGKVCRSGCHLSSAARESRAIYNRPLLNQCQSPARLQPGDFRRELEGSSRRAFSSNFKVQVRGTFECQLECCSKRRWGFGCFFKAQTFLLELITATAALIEDAAHWQPASEGRRSLRRRAAGWDEPEAAVCMSAALPAPSGCMVRGKEHGPAGRGAHVADAVARSGRPGPRGRHRLLGRFGPSGPGQRSPGPPHPPRG